MSYYDTQYQQQPAPYYQYRQYDYPPYGAMPDYYPLYGYQEPPPYYSPLPTFYPTVPPPTYYPSPIPTYYPPTASYPYPNYPYPYPLPSPTSPPLPPVPPQTSNTAPRVGPSNVYGWDNYGNVWKKDWGPAPILNSAFVGAWWGDHEDIY